MSASIWSVVSGTTSVGSALGSLIPMHGDTAIRRSRTAALKIEETNE
jgi:hypothetical protein